MGQLLTGGVSYDAPAAGTASNPLTAMISNDAVAGDINSNMSDQPPGSFCLECVLNKLLNALQGGLGVLDQLTRPPAAGAAELYKPGQPLKATLTDNVNRQNTGTNQSPVGKSLKGKVDQQGSGKPLTGKADKHNSAKTHKSSKLKAETAKADKKPDPLTLEGYAGWDQLIKDKKATEAQKKILSALTKNEGQFGSLNHWDSNPISLGVIQKTINPDYGSGELATQIAQFAKANPQKYKELFADKGWTYSEEPFKRKIKYAKPIKGKLYGEVEDHSPRLFYQDPKNAKAKPITGEALKTFTHGPKSDARDRALDALKAAGEDPEFQKKQMLDAIHRLNAAMNVKPHGYDGHVSDYLSSQRAAALVLDESINRPAHVDHSVGKALDKFFKAHPEVDKDPSKWGDKRAEYEKEILKYYAGDPSAKNPDPGTRGEHDRMTDPIGRRDKIDGYKPDETAGSMN